MRLYLPPKELAEIEYNLNLPNTYTWTAPDRNRDGSDYQIKCALYGGGGGSSNNTSAVICGGHGGYIDGTLTVTPGLVYTLIVGAGGATALFTGGYVGQNGSSTIIQRSGTNVVLSEGGIGGGTTQTTAYSIENNGGTQVPLPAYFTTGTAMLVDSISRSRVFNGTNEFGKYDYHDVHDTSGYFNGGIGGNDYTTFQEGNLSLVNGSPGRIVMRFTMSPSIPHTPPA